VEQQAGGKAAHVATAAQALGHHVVWSGFLGGAIGNACCDGLHALGIDVIAFPSSAATRINLEIIDESSAVTEILEPGVAPSVEEQTAMLDFCTKAFAGQWKGAILAISGSLPPGMRSDFYAELIHSAYAAGSKAFVDTSGDWLVRALEAKPHLVKINRQEAETFLKKTITNDEAALAAAEELIHFGATSVAITLGDAGLVWVESAGGPAWRAAPPKVQCFSGVGCGDATLAGFMLGEQRKLPPEEALRLATATGAANCLAKWPGRIEKETVESLMSEVQIQQLR
jgi:1-phosphofructokinase family hexose kinase